MATGLAGEQTTVEGYAAPRLLAEAARLAARGRVTPLAGGTDLMVQSQSEEGRLEGTLLNLRHLPELRGIKVAEDRIRIGAGVTVTEVLESDLLARHATILVQTADQFACNQLRNMATIGGNICNASPAGDMIIALLALDAEVELARWQAGGLATRRLPLAQFFTAPGGTVRRPDEILTAVLFDRPDQRLVGGFLKFGPRPALEVAVAAVGIVGIFEDGILRAVRVAFGAVAPTPIRGSRTEYALEGRRLDPATIAAAARAAGDEVSPISDLRASRWYRRHLVGILTEEVLSHVAQG